VFYRAYVAAMRRDCPTLWSYFFAREDSPDFGNGHELELVRYADEIVRLGSEFDASLLPLYQAAAPGGYIEPVCPCCRSPICFGAYRAIKVPPPPFMRAPAMRISCAHH
jgi:hypothetical protein